MSYEEKCKELGLATLEKRWNQDMTQVFKIISRKDRLSPTKLFRFRQDSIHTRTAGDPLHLSQNRAKLDLRRNAFALRVVEGWKKIMNKNPKVSEGSRTR